MPGWALFKPSDFAVQTDEAFFSELGNFGLYIGFLYLAFSRISENRMTSLIITLSVVAAQLVCHRGRVPTSKGIPGFWHLPLCWGGSWVFTTPKPNWRSHWMASGKCWAGLP